MRTKVFAIVAVVGLGAVIAGAQAAKETVIHVALDYRAPGTGPAPNFSPKGTQVPLTAVPVGAPLPDGAVRPAKTGVIKVGPDNASWIPVLATADVDHPRDLCRLYLDRNRNGNYRDDGPAMSATPTLNEKTQAWWSSINKVELSVPYGAGAIEPYLVNFWLVRDDAAPAPDILRYSVGSWRSGTASVNGVPALVAAMDSDNDAIFANGDNWSVIAADAPNAEKAVLSIAEARQTNRFMFLPKGDKELVLEFRGFSLDGRSIEFAVVDRMVTKAADRAPDDMVGAERSRPRTQAPFVWVHDFATALANAKSTGKRVIVDFETTWCGPCKSMDEWIWTDAEVATQLTAGFVGVKLDGDIEKALVAKFKVAGYPTILVLDATGAELKRAVGYQSSKETLTLIAK